MPRARRVCTAPHPEPPHLHIPTYTARHKRPDTCQVSSTDALGPRARDLVDGLRVAMGFVARVRAAVGVPERASFREIEREVGLVVRQAAQCA